MNQSATTARTASPRSGRAQRSQAALVARYVQELSAGKRAVPAARPGCGPVPAEIGRVAA